MRLLRPEFAAWWYIVPAVVACWLLRVRYVRARRAAGGTQDVQPSRRSHRAREWGVLVFALLAVAALAFSLLRPQVMLAQRVPDLEQQDVIIVLDRSASMRARDIAPSRIGRATAELRRLLQGKPDAVGRLGLVGFADAAVILSYLTRDADSLLFYLDWVDRSAETLLGTDIGAALKSARDVARKDGRPTRKVFLLLSDGEDHGAELDRQLALFRTEGRRVHCIGIGGDTPTPIPIVDADGREDVLQDESGRPVQTAFDESTLRRVAAETGGRYFRSTTGGELAAAVDEVLAGEARILGWRTTTEYRDVYPFSLAVAALAATVLWLFL